MLLTTLLLQAGLSLGTLGKAIGAGFAAFAAGFGISKIGSASLEAGARQPEQASHYRMTAIIISALIEGASLFAIVVCLIVS
ncbi:MAG: ATP synthase F0 subunit C [Bacteroidales bacterium]|jgi:F-type H+-transporting ATPase subunit c|nr:ATP synthase F0 subunit C [Bacteroidales bacterium]MCI2134604.1 ATP synthase F0 subunit C [Bacteroidales bacterium]